METKHNVAAKQKQLQRFLLFLFLKKIQHDLGKAFITTNPTRDFNVCMQWWVWGATDNMLPRKYLPTLHYGTAQCEWAMSLSLAVKYFDVL